MYERVWMFRTGLKPVMWFLFSFDMGVIFSLAETASETLVFSFPMCVIKGLKSQVNEKELLWLLITVAWEHLVQQLEPKMRI